VLLFTPLADELAKLREVKSFGLGGTTLRAVLISITTTLSHISKERKRKLSESPPGPRDCLIRNSRVISIIPRSSGIFLWVLSDHKQEFQPHPWGCGEGDVTWKKQIVCVSLSREIKPALTSSGFARLEQP
jgi:hypothetical protein